MKVFTTFLALATTLSTLAAVPSDKLRHITPVTEMTPVKVETTTAASRNAKKKISRKQKSKPELRPNDLSPVKRVSPVVKAAANTVTYNPNFSNLTQGSESSPVMIALDDDGNIPASLIGEANYGFGGAGLAQAGGALYIHFVDPGTNEEGFLWTPDITAGSTVKISCDVKIANSSSQEDEFYCVAGDFYGNQVYADGVTVTPADGWKHVEYNITGTDAMQTESGYCQLWFYEEADAMIKNLVMEISQPLVATPQGLEATDYTGFSFVANWEAVDNATAYLLNVYRYDPGTDEMTPYLKDVEVKGATKYTVTGIKEGEFFAYTVTATDGENYSNPSSYVYVMKLVAPANVKVAIEDNQLKASWDAVNGANYYLASATRHHLLKQGENFAITDADFSSFSSNGTLDSPVESEYLSDEFVEMPGWTWTLVSDINGAHGLMTNWIYSLFGYDASIQSPLFDCSVFENGEVKFDLDLCAGQATDYNGNASEGATSLLVGLLYLDPSTGEYEIGDSHQTDDLNGQFTKHSFSLKCPHPNSVILMLPVNENDDDCSVYFKSIKVSGISAVEDEIQLQAGSVEGETTSVVFPAAPVAGDNYSVKARAYLVDFDSSKILASSDPSAPGITSGIQSIKEDLMDDGPARYYNLQGVEIANPKAGSIYIKVNGAKAQKVLVK